MPNLLDKWRDLKAHPVYLREQGEWGDPNPFYTNINRYWPFIGMGAIVLSMCGSSSTLLNLFSSNDEELATLFCLICIPAALLTMLTLYGVFMAPALTAPMISLEQSGGSWDMLRMTPFSTRSILMAKLFGALSRLKIWWPMLILGAIETAGLFISAGIAMGFNPNASITLTIIAVNTFVRPWAEVMMSALLGMFISMWVSSATTALAATYGIVIFFRLFSSSLLWVAIFSAFIGDIEGVWFGQILSTVFYYLAIGGLIYGIRWKAEKMFIG